jgi:hypothetical protein
MTSHGYKQNEISQELSMGTKIFKTSYYTVLKAFSFKKIQILMTSTTLIKIRCIVVLSIN